MEYLFGLLALLLGALGFNYVKRKSAEALLLNTDTKEKVLDLERERAKLNVKKELEDLKRDLLEKNAEERKKMPIDPKDFQ